MERIKISAKALENAGWSDETGGWGGSTGVDFMYSKDGIVIRTLDYDNFWHYKPFTNEHRQLEFLDELDGINVQKLSQ